jgi:hypothetical protein
MLPLDLKEAEARLTPVSKRPLTAINALIESHREEFVVLVNEIEQRRAWNEKKIAMSEKKTRPNIGGL